MKCGWKTLKLTIEHKNILQGLFKNCSTALLIVGPLSWWLSLWPNAGSRYNNREVIGETLNCPSWLVFEILIVTLNNCENYENNEQTVKTLKTMKTMKTMFTNSWRPREELLSKLAQLPKVWNPFDAVANYVSWKNSY